MGPKTTRTTSPGVIAAKTLIHALALVPAAILAWQIRQEYLTGSGGLGADPVAEIEHRLGLWALRFLMITLAITPLRQIIHQPVLIRFRRMLGLYAFFYATLHLSAYLVLDLRGYWAQIFEEIAKRPYITVGFTAWLLLVPLAAHVNHCRDPQAGPQLDTPAPPDLPDRGAGGTAFLVAGEVRRARTSALRRHSCHAARLAIGQASARQTGQRAPGSSNCDREAVGRAEARRFRTIRRASRPGLPGAVEQQQAERSGQKQRRQQQPGHAPHGGRPFVVAGGRGDFLV